MVRGMARRVHRLEAPLAALDRVAVARHDIRREIPVATLLGARLAALAAGMRTEAVSRRSGRRLQRPGGRRMIPVSVSNEDVGHPLAVEAGQQRLDMLGEIGTGIDDGDLAFADDIGAGALIGERARVAGDDPPEPWGDRFE